MNARIISSVKLLALVLVIAQAFSGCGEKDETSIASPYDFSLRDLEGEKVSFSDFQGRVIMINFWAPWCGPCRMETPDLVALYDEYESEGLQILGVAVSFRGEQSVHDFAEAYRVNYPILLGNMEVIKSYGGFRGIPTTFLFSRNGELKAKFEGMRSRDVFERAIKTLL